MPLSTISTSRTATKLEGVAELKAALEGLGQEVATKIGQAANTRAAKIGAAAVRAAAPVSEIPEGATRQRATKNGSKSYPHRKIKNSIRVRKARVTKENLVSTDITTGPAFQAQFVEFGTKDQAAHPFFRPAIDGAAPAMQAAQIDELRTGIERAAKRLAKIKR